MDVVFSDVSQRTANVKQSGHLKLVYTVLVCCYWDRMAMLYTHIDLIKGEWSFPPDARVFKSSLLCLPCPYVLIQAGSNQDRLVIYRGLGLRFGMQLYALQPGFITAMFTKGAEL